MREQKNISHLPYQINPDKNRFHFYEQHWKFRARDLLCKYARSKGTLLDWGCGRGEALQIFSDAGFKVHGADIDPECVRLSSLQGFPVDQMIGEDPLSLYSPNSFDAVISLHVLEHVDCPKLVLRGLARVSKNYVLIGVPNAKTFVSPLLRKIALDSVNPGHLQIWDHHHILNLAVRHCGLELISWGFDATILPVFNRLAQFGICKPFVMFLEKGVFTRLFPFHGITCLGLFKKRGENA